MMRTFYNFINSLRLMLIVAFAAQLIGCGAKEEFEDCFGEEWLEADEEVTDPNDTIDPWERYYTMPLDSVLSILSRTRYLTTCPYGWCGGKNEQWGCHIRMNGLCSNEELVRLAKEHPAPVVRAMAFDVLHDRRYDGCYQLLKDCLDDTASIDWGVDIETESSVASYRVICMQIVNDGGNYTHLRMTPAQQRELDSILIFRPNMWHIDERLKSVLDTLSPEPRYYLRVRSMYLDEDILEALPVLARYQREQDLELIEEALAHYSDDGESYMIAEYGLKAVANWPDSRFWPWLRKIRRFVVIRHYTDGDYDGLMRGCVNAAYHYYLPKAARYIRLFDVLTLGKMWVMGEFCYWYGVDSNTHRDTLSNVVPRCYTRMYERHNDWEEISYFEEPVEEAI